MQKLDLQAQQVANHYKNDVFDYQKNRLEQESPIEYAITRRTFDKWIKDNSTILYVGVGVGHYAEYLAQRGCKFHLVDICQPFLTLSEERMAKANLSDHILSSTVASATTLNFIPDASIDCVLMMGPLYHLVSPEQREQSIREANRVLKQQGLLFAAAINRLAILHELFCIDRFFDGQEINLKLIYPAVERYCETGVSGRDVFSPLGDAYCATASEFRALFKPLFKEIDFLGVEAFAGFNQKKIFDKKEDERELWLDLIERMARSEEGFGAAEHLLYIGRSLRA